MAPWPSNQRVTDRCPFARQRWCGGGVSKKARPVGRRWRGQYSGIGAVFDREHPPRTGWTFSSPLICSYDDGLIFGEFSVRSARRPEAAAVALARAASYSVVDTCCVPSTVMETNTLKSIQNTFMNTELNKYSE